MDRKFLWCLAVMVTMVFGIFFRLYPLTVFPRYVAKNKAELLVYSSIQKSVHKFLDQKYAGTPEAAQNGIKNAALKQFISRQKAKVDATIEKTAQKILDNENKLKKPVYLMEVDPYYYLALTRRLVEEGSFAKRINGRK